MEILIVSKTQMSSGVCVGGITTKGEFVRLLDSNGHNQPFNCQYKIGQIYDVTFTRRENPDPPHIEDILCTKAEYKEDLSNSTKMIDFLNQKNAFICKGNINCLFDKSLKYTNKGHGYINAAKIPQNSVAFWITDKELIKESDSKYYQYKDKNPWITPVSIKYVGLETPPNIIPKGTLLRMSLARWWSPNINEVENRCYLQLSGWYK